MSKPDRIYRANFSYEEIRDLFNYRPDGVLVYKKNAGYNQTAGKVAGSPTSHGYWVIRVRKATMHAHRAVWLWHHGALPTADLDHINGDRLDNRIENLRLASRSENNHNAKKRSGTSSKWKGVSWSKGMKGWHAYIKPVDGKRATIGYFKDEADAAQAYNFNACAEFGPFAKLNESPQPYLELCNV